jgi:hypothetical protein
MPDPIEPTPEISRESEPAGRPDRDAALTTASLAKAAQAETSSGEPTRSFAGSESAAGAAGEQEAREQTAPLFVGEETARMRAEWDAIQASFVDEPRQAVEAADRLVATAIRRLAEVFAEEKGRLEGQWDRGGDVSTEDLRQALRRYRSFFGRVLSV